MILREAVGRSRAYDILHRIGVYACIGMTVFGITVSGSVIFSGRQALIDNELTASVESNLPDGVSAITSNEGLQQL